MKKTVCVWVCLAVAVSMLAGGAGAVKTADENIPGEETDRLTGTAENSQSRITRTQLTPAAEQAAGCIPAFAPVFQRRK